MTLCSKNRYRKAPRQVTDVMQTSMLRLMGVVGSARVCFRERAARAPSGGAIRVGPGPCYAPLRIEGVQASVFQETVKRSSNLPTPAVSGAGSRKTRPEWFVVQRS